MVVEIYTHLHSPQHLRGHVFAAQLQQGAKVKHLLFHEAEKSPGAELSVMADDGEEYCRVLVSDSLSEQLDGATKDIAPSDEYLAALWQLACDGPYKDRKSVAEALQRLNDGIADLQDLRLSMSNVYCFTTHKKIAI